MNAHEAHASPPRTSLPAHGDDIASLAMQAGESQADHELNAPRVAQGAGSYSYLASALESLMSREP